MLRGLSHPRLLFYSERFNREIVMSKYYVYLHRTLCGKVFYVGKGTGYRVKERGHRSKAWYLFAMLLHDTVEDCGVSFEEIENMFGERVKDIVYHVTEPKFFGSDSNPLTWKERKENYLALLETGPAESLLVAICDKIHNMSTINKNLVHEGTFWFLDKVLEIFENRKSEIPESLLNKYKLSLKETRDKYAN
jgi:hypothetical protein